MEELAEEARELREVLRRHRAGLEHDEAAVVQDVTKRGAEPVVQLRAIEPEPGDARAHGGFSGVTQRPPACQPRVCRNSKG